MTGNAGGERWRFVAGRGGERKRPGEKLPGGEVLMARRGGIQDDGEWPVRSRGEDGERGGSDVRKEERIREWWGQESEMVSAEGIWRFPGEGLLGKTEVRGGAAQC